MTSKPHTCLGILIVLVGCAGLSGCRSYPVVTSKEAMQLMKLLYTACNTQDTARLAQVEKGIERLTREGKLSAPEQEAFTDIVALAKNGAWKDAEKAAFQFAEDQVGRGHASPDGNCCPPKRPAELSAQR